MDAVITYVDGNDPVWRKSFAQAVGVPAIEKRYRDWGTLVYLVRGIRRYMPFIRKIFLVVSGESQVPSWVSGSDVRVVLHSEIIPQRFLPVFNSTAIEMFLHRIPELDEQFVYFNDDMFPVRHTREEEFYVEGKSVIGFRKHLFPFGLYKQQTRNADLLARKALGMAPGPLFVRPQHTCSPMQKSACEEVYARIGDELEASISPLREKYNVNQYVFLDYLYYGGRTVKDAAISNLHLSLAVKSADQVCDAILNPRTSFVCINDVKLSEPQYLEMKTRILEAFEKKFTDE